MIIFSATCTIAQQKLSEFQPLRFIKHDFTEDEKKLNRRDELLERNMLVTDGVAFVPLSNNEKSELDSLLIEYEEKLQHKFGTGIGISHQTKKGRIEIEFYDEGDLERILELLLDGVE